MAFVRCFEAAVDEIVANPTFWREIEEDVRRHLLKRFPYGLYYTIEEDFILTPVEGGNAAATATAVQSTPSEKIRVVIWR